MGGGSPDVWYSWIFMENYCEVQNRPDSVETSVNLLLLPSVKEMMEI